MLQKASETEEEVGYEALDHDGRWAGSERTVLRRALLHPRHLH